MTTNNHSNLFVGVDTRVPVLDGSRRRYINFDNAASTPPLNYVLESIMHFMQYYSSVHRGTGFKSQLSTHAYEQSRHSVMQFLGADPQFHTCIFGKNTTEAINKLARRFQFTSERNVVLTSSMEHHSNDLPWRASSETVHIKLTPDGRLDEDDFDAKLAQYIDRLALVAITGASNVTGFINPIHRLAEKTHLAGGKIFVDCAQLAPHRKVDMRPIHDPTHLDYVAISAHKLYAPFGTGALVGLKETFAAGDPDMTGGGTVEIVTLDDVVWAGPPDRDEAGSPNTVGAVALAAAIHQLEEVGMEVVTRHEAELTAYAIERLHSVPKIHLYGDQDPTHNGDRLGVIPFLIEGISHFLIASILGYEYAIGVRSGCFCAHPYILHLLGLSSNEENRVRQQLLSGNRSEMPGMVRVSFGLYNTFDEVDVLIDALMGITRGKFDGSYAQDFATGEYSPSNWSPPFDEYFTISSQTQN